MMARHGHLEPRPVRYKVRCRRLLKKLERLRKRAKRAYIRDHGQAAFAELAVKFGCSKSLVRDLVRLANLPGDLKQAYLEGKVGGKRVLEMARARKKKVEAKAVAVTEDLKKDQQQKALPEAKAVVTPNPQQNTPSIPHAVVAPGDLQQLLIRVAAPAMTEEEERQKEVAEHAKLIIDWFRSRDLAFCFWPGFWSQVNAALYGPFPWLFADEAPQPHEIRPGVNPLEVI